MLLDSAPLCSLSHLLCYARWDTAVLENLESITDKITVLQASDKIKLLQASDKIKVLQASVGSCT